jgi:hypothetical protein
MGDHKSGRSQQGQGQQQGQNPGQNPSQANPAFNFGSMNPGYWGFNPVQAAPAPEQPVQTQAQMAPGMGQAPMMNLDAMAQAWQQMQAMQQQMTAMQQQMAFMSQAQAYAQTQAPGQPHPSGHDQGQAQRQGQGLGQSQGMAQFMQEISSGGTGLNSLTKMLDFDDKDFWKGALVGAAVIMLFTNESLQNMLFKGAVKSRDAVKDGVEKVKDGVEKVKTKVKSGSKAKTASNESSTSASEQ